MGSMESSSCCRIFMFVLSFAHTLRWRVGQIRSKVANYFPARARRGLVAGAPSNLQFAPRCMAGFNAAVLLAFHKPYGVLSQFTPDGSTHRTLAAFGFPPRVYPIGRLDADSEGLLLLSGEPVWNERLLHPRHAHDREYWVQVERIPPADALAKLAAGVVIQGRRTLPCRARLLDPQPVLPPRQPPIRFRKNVPDCWLALELTEGRNRQVRRMTAAIGHPTLRLVRVRIGAFTLGDLAPGKWRELDAAERAAVLGGD
jgi:23S rRNA pseudouridine2457 synthase